MTLTNPLFDSTEFKEAWSDWLEYKRIEHKFNYKSEQSVKAALRKLNKLSFGNEAAAIEIIEESMANGWKGFFALKQSEINKIKVHEPKVVKLQKYG